MVFHVTELPHVLQYRSTPSISQGNHDTLNTSVEIPTQKKNEEMEYISSPILSSTLHLEQPLKAEYPKVYRSDGSRHIRYVIVAYIIIYFLYF